MQDYKIHSLLDLKHTLCELYHHPKDPAGQAVDYLIQHFGTQLNEVESQVQHTIHVPICKECSDALQGGMWFLLYCFNCCESRWILAKLSKYNRPVVSWLPACPECYKKKT